MSLDAVRLVVNTNCHSLLPPVVSKEQHAQDRRDEKNEPDRKTEALPEFPCLATGDDASGLAEVEH